MSRQWHSAGKRWVLSGVCSFNGGWLRIVEHRDCGRQYGVSRNLVLLYADFFCSVSSLILGVTLSHSFWQGVVMVTVGSLMCWLVTKEKREAAG